MLVSRRRASLHLWLTLSTIAAIAWLSFCAPRALAQGPDLVIDNISSIQSFGTVSNVHAYSIASVNCNIGTDEVLWESSTDSHPVFVQNLYRVFDGRVEQIGMSWARHAFCALQMSACGVCTPSANCAALGVGCSTTNSAAIAASQGTLGPRSEINPFDGTFLYPFTGIGMSGNAVFRRLQVADDDIDAVLYPGARYFVEAQAVAGDEATSGNSDNSISYREVTFSSTGAVTPGPSLTGATFVGASAVDAWKLDDPLVEIVDVVVPNDGLLRVGYRVFDEGGGEFRYEYAVQNTTCARAVSAISVPVPTAVTPTDLLFHGIAHHSGEPYDDAPWDSVIGTGEVSWSTDSFATDPNANALRWGTLYTFSLTAEAPPVATDVTLTLFEPGLTATVTAAVFGPAGAGVEMVRGDCNNDAATNISDAVFLLTHLFGQGVVAAPDCEKACDANDDGSLNISDPVALLGSLFGAAVTPLPDPTSCGLDTTSDALDCGASACP